MAGLVLSLILLYGPWAGFRDFIITSAMTTLHHQWIATTFYEDNVISKVMAANTVIPPDEDTNADLVDINSEGTSTNELIKRRGSEPYRIVDINRNGYKGYMTIIYDAAKVKLGVSQYLGVKGELISAASKNAGALLAINSSGFLDTDGLGNGGTPTGALIQNGKVLWGEYSSSHIYNFIGFDKNHILTLLRATTKQATEKGIIDAVDFAPFLIVNGRSAITKGNGGWGLAPRTAIGQRQDGIVLFLIIDGRQTQSIGASIIDVLDLMTEFGAINAANLDGGSSSILVVDGKIKNKPSSTTGERRTPAWFMLMP